MRDYEQLSEDCKICWIKGFELKSERHTQVSGYIFNSKGELLIVRNENTWTVPGGHPESGETPLETLNREVMEEACVTIKNIKNLGAVEVVERGETYYQLRYFAMVDEELPFTTEWEISERLFVDLKDLPKYIKWSKGITFSKQLDDANDVLMNK